MSLSLLEELALLPAEVRDEVLGGLPHDMACALEDNWFATARPEQLPPAWPWEFFILLGGRGSGKTRPAAELVHQWAMEPHVYIALIGETAAEVRDVMVEGPSGLLATAKPWNPVDYHPSKRRVEWANGSWGTTFSGDAPDQLRGPNAQFAWLDEVAKFRYPKDTMDNLDMILRVGTHPQAVISTTPRPIPVVKDLLADCRPIHPHGHNALAKFTTYDNIANLAPSFIHRVIRKYEGTRIGRQELLAEMLDDTPGALWTRDILEAGRVTEAPRLLRVVVGVDPHASSGETGIVVAGKDARGHGYVLDDASTEGSPDTWARRVVDAYRQFLADRIIAEANNGGDMVLYTIATQDKTVVTKKIWASRGKQARAEPVSALYEQRRVHHVGMFPLLEDQMCSWVPGETAASPDRVDALVWALTELLITARETPILVPDIGLTAPSAWRVG